MIVNEKDVLESYKESGHIKSYNFGGKYSQFLRLRKAPLKKSKQELRISTRCLYHWTTGDRVPRTIQTINRLKENKILPLYASEPLARIIGYIHGDGWINHDLKGIGFCSAEMTMLKQFRNDMKKVFGLEGEPVKMIKSGDTVIILGKNRTARKDVHRLMYNNSGVCRIIFKAGEVRGKKVFNEFFIPEWISDGKIEYQRGFLNGLFDSEMSNFRISTFEGHKNNISAIRMEMCKSENLIHNSELYFNRIKKMLKGFGVRAHISEPIFVRTDKSGKNIFKHMLWIRDFRSFHNFITKIGFLASHYKKEKSKFVLSLIKQKIRNRNRMYDVMCYILNKEKFTTKDLEKDLQISRGYTKMIAKTLYNLSLSERRMRKEKGKEYVWWYEYTPIKKRIKRVLDDDILLLDVIPNRKHA